MDQPDAVPAFVADYRARAEYIAKLELNRVLQKARERLAPKAAGKIPKLFYATQVGVHPPTILVFVNDPELFTGQYDRYLQNRLREAFPWKEVPVRLAYKPREKVELPPE